MATEKELQEEIKTLTYVAEHLSSVIRQYNYYFQVKLGAVYPYFKKSDSDYYAFVPSVCSDEVVRQLMYIRQYLESRHTHRPLKFLDCGCGIGNILMIASCTGFHATGIEHELDTYKLGRDILDNRSASKNDDRNNIDIIKGNILFFRHYKDYDVIYYYTPIMNRQLQAKFVRKLVKNAKIGAIIIPYANGANGDRGELSSLPQLKRIGGRNLIHCYEKVK